jgi:predicted RNA-binding protein with PIN domain
VPDPTLYLFDGYNLLHAGEFRDRQELVDRLADYVALRGARGVVVFDGAGDDAAYGPVDVRFASSADRLLERLAAENRDAERVCLVSSDRDIRGTAGQEVRKLDSSAFVRELAAAAPQTSLANERARIEDALDEETRKRLERWRRERI